MDISCHSFVRMSRLAAPLLADGGTMFAITCYGADRIVPNYNVMGPVNAALGAACRYLAFDFGPKKIRVHAISPGPIENSSGVRPEGFRLDAERGGGEAPLGELADIMDVGLACAFLVTDFARRITGRTAYVDGART